MDFFIPHRATWLNDCRSTRGDGGQQAICEGIEGL